MNNNEQLIREIAAQHKGKRPPNSPRLETLAIAYVIATLVGLAGYVAYLAYHLS